MHSEVELALAKPDVLMGHEDGDVLGSADRGEVWAGKRPGAIGIETGSWSRGQEGDSLGQCQGGERTQGRILGSANLSRGAGVEWGKYAARRLGRTGQGARSRMEGESGHQGSQGKGQFHNGAGQLCQMSLRD